MMTLTRFTMTTLIDGVPVILPIHSAIRLLAEPLTKMPAGRLAPPGWVIARLPGAGVGNPVVAAVLTSDRPAVIGPQTSA